MEETKCLKPSDIWVDDALAIAEQVDV